MGVFVNLCEMGRGKLQVRLIADEKARRERFKRRKKGLKKAAGELSTLCGVDIGMIIYVPAQGKDSDQPIIIWPKNQEVVAGLIESYKSRLGHDGRNRTYNLSDYFKEKTEAVEDQLKKLREKKIKYPMPDDDKYNFTSLEDLKQFDGRLMVKIDAVRGRINLMKGQTSLFTRSDCLMNQCMWSYDQLACYDSLQANMDNQNMGMGTGITENVGVSEDFISNYTYGFGTGTTTENVMQMEQLMSYNDQYIEPLIRCYSETISE